MKPEIGFLCSGCGARSLAVSEELFPFRCARAKDLPAADHVLIPNDWEMPDEFPSEFDENPFVLYRQFSTAYRVALAYGMSDEQYQEIVRQLNERIAQVDGRGFHVTPYVRALELEQRLEYRGGLWIKNETGNVSGSHKGRHLMGILLYLEVLSRLFPGRFKDAAAQPRLAIASCGNAALAASVLAKAANRPISVFIPEGAEPGVVERLRRLDADIHVCARKPGTVGDPCVLAFQQAVARGALPFCCQGNENGMAIEGAKTIGYEIISMILSGRAEVPETMIVQVGGGALASALIYAFEDAVSMGVIQRVPRICTVQTMGAYPLKRAYERIVSQFDEKFWGGAPVFGAGLYGALKRAAYIRETASPSFIEQSLHDAAQHRADFMFPWESEPKSIAHGILDDETYDWLAIVRGMLLSGGIPIVAPEATLKRANEIGRDSTLIDVDETGSAGLAGFLEVLGAKINGIEKEFGRVFIVFSGRRR